MNALIAATISLSLIAGCDGAARNQERMEAVTITATDSAALSSAKPMQSLAIPAEAGSTGKFSLTVSRVRNPGRVPVELTTTLLAPRDTIAIGSVALYPPDSGGVFVISLPERARSVISQSLRAKVSVQMLIRLSNVRRGEVALTVTVGGWEH